MPGWRGNFHPNDVIFWANVFYYAISKENAVQHNFFVFLPIPIKIQGGQSRFRLQFSFIFFMKCKEMEMEIKMKMVASAEGG